MPGTRGIWTPTSAACLEEVEAKVLSAVQTPHERTFITLDNGEQVRTLIFKADGCQSAMPLVLVHGFGAAVGCWVKNMDALASRGPLYVIDQIGFGRSSRPSFPEDAEGAEEQLVDALEMWREAIGLEEFIILGHSLGGYVTMCYALKYPQRIRHVIMADPFGLQQRPESADEDMSDLLLKYRMVRSIVEKFNIFTLLRIAGPLGPRMVRRARPDLQELYSDVFPDWTILDYFYHCNTQPASGEIAMKALNLGFGWAARPILPRIMELDKKLKVSFIYGEDSWMDPRSGYSAKYILGTGRVTVDLVPDVGHHVYSSAKRFNSIVLRRCSEACR